MGRKKAPSEAVFMDSTNCAASAKTSVEELSSQGQGAEKKLPVTFSRKAKSATKFDSSTKENAEHTPYISLERALTAESASPTLTDFLTPLSEAQSSFPEAFLSARTQQQRAASSSRFHRLGSPEQEGVGKPAEEQGRRERKANYPRKVAPSRGEQQGAAHTDYMARMAAHFAEVDDFDLNVDSPSAAGAASPVVAPQPAAEAAELAAEAGKARHTNRDSTLAGDDRRDAATAYTARWLRAVPSPEALPGRGASEPRSDSGSDADGATAAGAPTGEAESSREKCAAADKSLEGACGGAGVAAEGPLPAAAAEITERRLTLTAPEDEACDGEEDAPEQAPAGNPPLRQPSRSSVAGRVNHKAAGRLSLAHARKSLAGARLQPMERRSLLDSLPIHPHHSRESEGPQPEGRRRTSVYETLSSRFSLNRGLARVSVGLTSALNRLSLGPSASQKDSLTEAKGQEVPAEALHGAAIADRRERAISPIAESPESSQRNTSATPEAISLVADSSALQEAQPEASASHSTATEDISQQLDAQLHISEEAGVLPEQAHMPEELLTPLQQLLKLCDQQADVETLPSMEQLLGQHVKLRTVKKIGEGTFGEAFKGGDVVFKIVPMEGSLLVNGEPQKKAEEITAEVAIALTLSQLHPEAGVAAQNSTQGFVLTHSVGMCRGRYASALVREWHAWDKRKGSENDPVDMFGDDQLFVVFVVDNGGADLEHFEVHSFEEARSIILQTVLALAVAEEAAQFEHRDLHWGNLLIKRVPAGQRIACTLRGVEVAAESHGVQITLIDFTLSRLCTIDGSGAYCDLDADPELFQGPKGDCQADTYRRMRKATKGRWEGFHPATNALWMHYLADTLLSLKAFPLDPSQKKRLRDFRKHALSGQSCSDLLMDEFLKGSWLAGGR